MVMHRNTFSSNLQRSDHRDKIELQGTTIQLISIVLGTSG